MVDPEILKRDEIQNNSGLVARPISQMYIMNYILVLFFLPWCAAVLTEHMNCRDNKVIFAKCTWQNRMNEYRVA